MAKKHMKIQSTSLANWEMQLKPQQDTTTHRSEWLCSTKNTDNTK